MQCTMRFGFEIKMKGLRRGVFMVYMGHTGMVVWGGGARFVMWRNILEG